MRKVIKVDCYGLFIQIMSALYSDLCKLLLLIVILFMIFNIYLVKAMLLLWFVNLSRYNLIEAHFLLFLCIFLFCTGLNWLKQFGSEKPMALIFKVNRINCSDCCVEKLYDWFVGEEHSLVLLL